MKVFKAEKIDGLGDKLQCNTIACISEVEHYTPSQEDLSRIKAIAENKDQLDLFYLKSVLVSTGWNKNDDVFDAVELWKARTSPEDKQFNYMHDEKDIIGHITGSYAISQAGTILPDINDMSQVPSAFDIVTGGVLYTSWTDEKLKARMQKIIAEVESGKTWYVSMECLFPAFDYAMIDAKGQQKIIKREETSAFLTKHLKAYGGNGEYDGHKVGRLLRNFAFSGVGLVKNPANPRSVILNYNNSNKVNDSKAEEIIMSDELEALKAELALAKEAGEKMKEKMEEEMEKKKAEVQTSAETIQSLQDAVAALKKDLEDVKQKAEMDKKQLDQMKKEKVIEKRKAELVIAGLSSEDADQAVAEFDSVSDEVFQVVVANLGKVANKSVSAKPAPFKDAQEPSGPDDSKPAKMAKKPKASVDAELDPAEASEDVLNSAEADHDIAMAESGEDVFESVKSFASQWFSNSVLKSTANLKN
jgi:hypothetical protein